MMRPSQAMRDEIALAALKSMIVKWPPVSVDDESDHFDRMAQGAYAYADAMMKERARK